MGSTVAPSRKGVAGSYRMIQLRFINRGWHTRNRLPFIMQANGLTISDEQDYDKSLDSKWPFDYRRGVG